MNKYRCYYRNIFRILSYRKHYLRFVQKRSCNSSVHVMLEEKIVHSNKIINNVRQSFCSQNTSEEDPFISIENSSIFYILNEKDKSLYNLLCPVLSPDIASLDSVITELQNSLTLKEVFDVLRNLSEPLSLNQACQTIFSLAQIKNTRQFKFKNSLIHINLDKNFYSLIDSNEQFIRVMTFLNENADRLADVASSLIMCLNSLNLQLSHELMVKLHLYLLKTIPTLDDSSLAQLSFVFINKGMKGYYTQVKILSEIKRRMRNLSAMEDFRLLSVIYCNILKILCKDNLTRYVDIVSSLIKDKKLDSSNLTDLILIMKVFDGLRYNVPSRVTNYIFEVLAQRIDELTPQQLIILSLLIVDTLESKKLLYRIQEQASRFIEECSSPALKADLLLCLSINSGTNHKQLYETMASDLINESYSGQDLGSLYKALRFLKTSNIQLCTTFWEKSFENMKEKLLTVDNSLGVREKVLSNFYKKYLYFNDNIRGQLRHYTLEHQAVSLLKAELKGFTQYLPTKVAHMLSFIIAYSDDLLEEWYEFIERNANQLNCFDIGMLSKAVQVHMNYNLHNNKRNMAFLSKLNNLLDCCIFNIIMEVKQWEDVISLTSSYVIRQGSTSSMLFQKLNEEHSKYLGQMNSKFLNQLLKTFKDASYINQEVFEAATDYVIENEENLLSSTIYRVLASFYALGFVPSEVNEFAEACQRILEFECQRMPCYQLLASCVALSFFKPLSSELIHFIFSVEFLDRLEEEIDGGYMAQNFASYVRGTLMRLNRIVCLDNPEEKIPWFHEKYCRDEREMRLSRTTSLLKDVSQILALILGDERLLCFHKRSPYYYSIDLEFALNEDGRPVSPYEQPKIKDIEKNLLQNRNDNYNEPYKRVAVLVRKGFCYSANNHTLIGACQMQRKHLEMLGYVVVEVPEHEWCSMSISSTEDKYTLLKSLIYKELIKIS